MAAATPAAATLLKRGPSGRFRRVCLRCAGHTTMVLFAGMPECGFDWWPLDRLRASHSKMCPMGAARPAICPFSICMSLRSPRVRVVTFVMLWCGEV